MEQILNGLLFSSQKYKWALSYRSHLTSFFRARWRLGLLLARLLLGFRIRSIAPWFVTCSYLGKNVWVILEFFFQRRSWFHATLFLLFSQQSKNKFCSPPVLFRKKSSLQILCTEIHVTSNFSATSMMVYCRSSWIILWTFFYIFADSRRRRTSWASLIIYRHFITFETGKPLKYLSCL